MVHFLQLVVTFQSVNMTTTRSAHNVFSELMALKKLEDHYVQTLLGNLEKLDFPASELKTLIKQQKAMNNALSKFVIKTDRDVEMEKRIQASTPSEEGNTVIDGN